jgi:hypothetical protein
MAKRDKRAGKRWSYTAGRYPHSVRVYERSRGGPLYAAANEPDPRGGPGRERKRSLGHRDRERAIEYADEQAAKLRRGISNLTREKPSARRILKLYRAHRSPDKGKAKQEEDRRQAEAWETFLGSNFDLSRLSRREWDEFIRRRRSGEIDGRGKLVADPGNRRAVRDRTVEKDLIFLRAVCRWACDWRDDAGRLLLESDPTRGYKMPRERNPRRLVANHDRVDAIRQHYRTPTMRIEWNARREYVESFLPEILEIVVGTGRRISAVCSLRSEDLELEAAPDTPWGAIVWPEDTDKQGKRWRCPISPEVRAALEAALTKRQRIGPGPLFPGPRNRREPICYYVASKWLRESERLAKLEPQDGTLWHGYRRLWASARKDLPDVDVAQAGGWSSLVALKTAYQKPDDETMLRVVTHRTELREVR